MKPMACPWLLESLFIPLFFSLLWICLHYILARGILLLRLPCTLIGYICCCAANYEIYYKLVKKKLMCRWWECVALPEDIDSSEEDSFRQQIRDLAFAVIMQHIIHFYHYEQFIFY